jgi:hypothetical protein
MVIPQGERRVIVDRPARGVVQQGGEETGQQLAFLPSVQLVEQRVFILRAGEKPASAGWRESQGTSISLALSPAGRLDSSMRVIAENILERHFKQAGNFEGQSQTRFVSLGLDRVDRLP